mmetsp:Transcript_61347/g.187314  ORF Transcript_61347/g.187314 Transcript_61347/m.187314 type:complete len:251 (-) Transcript_61347:752-1504(-)
MHSARPAPLAQGGDPTMVPRGGWAAFHAEYRAVFLLVEKSCATRDRCVHAVPLEGLAGAHDVGLHVAQLPRVDSRRDVSREISEPHYSHARRRPARAERRRRQRRPHDRVPHDVCRVRVPLDVCRVRVPHDVWCQPGPGLRPPRLLAAHGQRALGGGRPLPPPGERGEAHLQPRGVQQRRGRAPPRGLAADGERARGGRRRPRGGRRRPPAVRRRLGDDAHQAPAGFGGDPQFVLGPSEAERADDPAPVA